MDKAIINDAIYKVITNQYKKDAKEAHAIVVEAGYDIFKNDGKFYVENRKTNKWICAKMNWRRHVLHGSVNLVKYFENQDDLKVDLVGFLDKPVNSETHKPSWYRETSSSFEKYSRLSSAKNAVQYAKDSIERIKNQMAALQDELVYYGQSVERRELELKKVRKELGLA